MPLPRVHAVLKRNKGERHESSDIHITKLAQVKEISEVLPLRMDSAESDCSEHLLKNDDSACGDVPTALDAACVTSTPVNGSGNIEKADNQSDKKNMSRKDLTLELNQISLVPRTRNDSTHHPPKSKQSWLLRLFESKLFDMSLAVTYLFNSKEQGVQVYIGKLRLVSQSIQVLKT